MTKIGQIVNVLVCFYVCLCLCVRESERGREREEGRKKSGEEILRKSR